MASAVVDLALGTIRDLLVEEVKFLSGVKGQVKGIEAVLQSMQCFLKDVDKKIREDESAQNFVEKIKDLCYQIEDVVETYATEVALRSRRKGIKNILHRVACLACECHSVHEIGSEINTIEQEMAKLTARMERHGIMKEALEERGKGDDKSEQRKWLRRTYAHEMEEHFVGMEKDKSELVAMLLDDDRKYRIVSICGMGGLGKTTLAKKVYNHGDVQNGFEAFAWVCVSQDCEPKNVLQDLLKQLSKKDEFNGKMIKAMEEDELVMVVYNMLKKVKHLIVLDDIWEEKAWERLSKAFPIPDANCKILITTRKEEVANAGFPYHLGLLSEDEGWELLQKKAFIRRDLKDLRVEPDILQRIGKEMVRKCGCLPLAISVLGGILSEKDSFDSWENVKNDIDLYLRRSIGDGDGDGAIKQVLSLSYDDLPYHLKPCFLYLSLFKEDVNIIAGQLYLLWVAEGIVSPKHQEKDETLLDVAKRYLGELACRSMVQLEVDKIVAPGQIKFCHLHDLLRDLCLAKSVEEGFLMVMDFRGGKRPSFVPNSTTSSCLRRLAMYFDQDLEGLSQIPTPNQLRSLVLSRPLVVMDIVKNIPEAVIDFEKLKFLRALVFQNIMFEGKNLAEVIGKLIHLRRLAFWRCHFKELPSSIGGLPFLQTLEVVCGGAGVPTIPNVLWRIKRLRYLDLPFIWEKTTESFGGKLRLGGLDELEFLSGFNSEFCELTDLSELKNLRRLKAHIHDGTDNISKFIDIIEVKGNYLDTNLQIKGKCDFSSEEGGIVLRKIFMSCSIRVIILRRMDEPIGKLPKYEHGFFPNLTVMELKGKVLDNDSISTLGMLPKLRSLYLEYHSTEENEIVCHAGEFHQLRALKFHISHNLKKWTVENGAMPCLTTLDLDCKELEMMPEGLKFITTLQELDIRSMPKEFIYRVREGGEDFYKVRHVKTIEYSNACSIM